MRQLICDGVEELSWDEARQYAAKGCQELFQILEEIDPGNKCTFFRVRYPFGDTIMHDDAVYIPREDSQSVPLGDSNIPQYLKDHLGYRSIPFGILTENPVEVYRETEDRIFSIELSDPNKGIEIGIFEYFGLTPCYSVVSGARSLFMVPKISEKRHHKKVLKEYGLNCLQPKNILKHWHVFKQLYNSALFKTEWESEVLYLSKSWDEGLKKHKKSHAWEKLVSYLYKKGFEHSELGRRKLVLDVLWQKVAAIMNQEGRRADNYVLDTLRHLIYIFLGGTSASRPAIDDFAGPITEIQTIYLETYGLEQVPTIMRPCQFSFEKNQPVYYSMQNPMMISSSPNARQLQTIIEEMRDLMILKTILSQNYGNIKIDGIKLHDLIHSMKLEFFHRDLYSYGKDIRPTHEIPEMDADFLYSPMAKAGLTFADNGSFIGGCVKITRDENIDKRSIHETV
jgi:hypothetical protein